MAGRRALGAATTRAGGRCALGRKACHEGFSVLYNRAPRLFTDLAQARGEGRLPRLMSALERTRLLLSWWPGGESDRLAYLFASQAQTKSCIAW